MNTFCVISTFFVIFLLCPCTSADEIDSIQKQTCPCENPKHCQPPSSKADQKEVFGFAVKSHPDHWPLYDWTKLTTVVMADYFNESLMCLAHSHGVKVSYLAHSKQLDITNAAARKLWISDQLKMIKMYYLDGINFDYEQEISTTDYVHRRAYTALVQETSNALKKVLPHAQITVDVPYMINIWNRHYDYTGLAKIADFFFLMAYDEGFGKTAGANSAMSKADNGIKSYIRAGIGPNKLVLGLPWYGYIYQCATVVQNTCYIKKGPRKSVAQSPSYAYIVKLLATVPKAYRWNSLSETPYFTYRDAAHNVTKQVQYDNLRSLSLKYKLATSHGIRGVGIWHLDCLDYSDSDEGKKMRKEMFGALPSKTS